MTLLDPLDTLALVKCCEIGFHTKRETNNFLIIRNRILAQNQHTDKLHKERLRPKMKEE